MKYTPPPSEVKVLVAHMRIKHYGKFAKAKIVTVMRLGKWDKWGTLGLVSDKHQLAGIAGDYILTLNGDAWQEMTEKQKKALVDHELYHMAKKKDKQGNTIWRIRHHDVEEFIEIVKRYGTWRPNLKTLHETMNARKVS